MDITTMFKGILNEAKFDLKGEIKSLIDNDKPLSKLFNQAKDNDMKMLDFIEKFMKKYESQIDDLKKTGNITDSDIGDVLANI